MEVLVTIIEYFPIALAVFFGVLGFTVKRVRITCYIILVTALFNMFMQDSYDGLAMSGQTIGLLIMGGIDMMAAMTLLLFHADENAEKAPEQAIVFTLFAICHGLLAYEVMIKQYVFYDMYDIAVWGLTLAHVLLMGGYYEEFKTNFKEIWNSTFSGIGRVSSFITRVLNRKSRGDGVGGSSRNCIDANFSSDRSDRKTKKGEEGESYYES